MLSLLAHFMDYCRPYFILKTNLVSHQHLVHKYSTVSLIQSLMIQTALTILKIGSTLLCTCTQSLPSAKIFLLQEDSFVLGYFWR